MLWRYRAAPNTATPRVIEKLGMKPIGNINPHVPGDSYFVLYKKDWVTEN